MTAQTGKRTDLVKTRWDIGSFLIITAVTVLIWYWAAGETRGQDGVDVRVQFVAPDPDRWIVTPSELSVNLMIGGSQSALANAARVLRAPLVLELGRGNIPAESGPHSIDLLQALSNLELLREAKLNVVSVEPANVPIQVDKMVRKAVPVQINLPPGVLTEGDIEIDPVEAELVVPERYVPADQTALAVEGVLEPRQLQQLEPGRRHQLEVILRPTGALATLPAASIQPPTAKITFTVQSRTREITLPTVRVQIRSAPEILEEYSVLINEADKVLRDVTVTADSNLIRRIEAGELKVFAVVYLSTSDVDQRIESKAVTCFVTDGAQGGVTVKATVSDLADAPVIGLAITERAGG